MAAAWRKAPPRRRLRSGCRCSRAHAPGWNVRVFATRSLVASAPSGSARRHRAVCSLQICGPSQPLWPHAPALSAGSGGSQHWGRAARRTTRSRRAFGSSNGSASGAVATLLAATRQPLATCSTARAPCGRAGGYAKPALGASHSNSTKPPTIARLSGASCTEKKRVPSPHLQEATSVPPQKRPAGMRLLIRRSSTAVPPGSRSASQLAETSVPSKTVETSMNCATRSSPATYSAVPAASASAVADAC